MAVEKSDSGVFILSIIIGFSLLLFGFIFNYIRKIQSKSPNVNGSVTASSNDLADDSLEDAKTIKKEKLKKKDTKATTTSVHKWLISSLRTHTSTVLSIDFSSNGKYMATCSEDRSIYIWYVKEFIKRDNRPARVNVEFDHAQKVKFSPDNKAIITSLAVSENIRIFRLGKKEDGTISKITPAFDFPESKHSAEMINIGVACNGYFVMTCYNDTTIKIWTVKGVLLHSIDTLQVNNTHGCVSPCGRFVASSGFTSDVKVWQVCFDKGGNFKEVAKAFQLSGHTSGVFSFAFNSDSTRMASVSKDGTWKLWNTDIDFQKRQDPKLLKSWSTGTNLPSLLAMSSDGNVVAVATKKNISIYDVAQDAISEVLQNVHLGEITTLEFSNDSAFLVSGGDRTINIYHNVVGLRCAVRDLRSKLLTATTKAMKERLQDQIDQNEELLKKIEYPA